MPDSCTCLTRAGGQERRIEDESHASPRADAASEAYPHAQKDIRVSYLSHDSLATVLAMLPRAGQAKQ